jgi:hypothetical protein
VDAKLCEEEEWRGIFGLNFMMKVSWKKPESTLTFMVMCVV